MYRNKWYKRVLPTLLSVAMLFQMMPETVFAAGYADTNSAVEEAMLQEPAAAILAEESDDALFMGTTEGIPKAVLSIDENQLRSYFNRDEHGYSYNFVTHSMEAFYEEEGRIFATPAYATVLSEAVKYAVSARAESEIDDLDQKLVLQWQQKKDDSYADMQEGTPHAAGSYRLKISLPAQEGVYNAADPIYVNLEVKKAVLHMDWERVVRDVDPGMTVKELQDKNADVALLNANGGVMVKDTYVESISWKVTNAHTGAELNSDNVFLRGEDYYLEASVTLKEGVKDNYEMRAEAYPVNVGNAIWTWIDVTYNNADETIGKTYDRTAIDLEQDVLSKFTAKVVYNENGELKELEGAEITGRWYNTYYKVYEDEKFVPVDAGTYYYGLSYRDANGIYRASADYVSVEIAKSDIVIKPVVDGLKVYDGMKAGDIVKNVKYEVYEVKNGVMSSEALAIDDYFWGVYSSSLTQKYEPLFEIQKSTKNGEGQFTDWSTTLRDNERIEKSDDVSYRIIFSGKRVAYLTNGDKTSELDINGSLKNYQVDTKLETRETYNIAFTVLPSTKAVINVDAILQEGKGARQIDPITKTYNGENLYQSRSEYKKAVVTTEDGNTIAENADSKLEYTWYYSYYTMKEDWGHGAFYTKMTDNEIPCDAGVYKLTVSYESSKADGDEDTYVYADDENVYYVIQPQSAILTLSGEPAIYADGLNTVGSFLDSIQNYTAGTETYVKVEAYPVVVTEDEQGKVTVTKDGAPLSDALWEELDYYFAVEKKVTVDGNESWESCGEEEFFVAGTDYRLSAYTYDNYDDYGGNYNFGAKLDVLNLVEKADYYENESLAIKVKETLGKEVTIKVDETKLTNTTKIYDGKPFDLEELKSLVTVEADGQNVKDQVELHYAMDYDDYYRYAERASVDYAIHGNTYQVYIYTETDDTYKAASKTLDTTYTITPRALTVTPVLEKNIKAGSSANAYDIVSGYTVEGLAETDDVNDVINRVSWKLCKSTSDNSFYATLRSSETYYVQGTYVYYNIDSNWRYGNFSYNDDYEVKVYERAAFTPERVAAEVVSTSYYSDATRLKDSVKVNKEGNFEHNIEAIESVSFTKYFYIEDEPKEGNFFVFNINAPGEFNNGSYSFRNSDFVYRNSIEKAGGYVLNDTTSSYTPYLTVAFDVSQGGKPSFEILWEKDYAETFTVNLAGMVPEADLTKAVAPKSLSFNGANTKMAVGDTQQLDVKIGKAQMSDTILLGYSVDNENVCEVTDTGYVTAISKGTATVTVYPCYYVNGVKTPITGKGVKSAKVKITVTDVAVPKVSKVTTADTSATIQYTRPANGYRREIYVMNGKKTVAQFEDEIAKVQNGDYSAFVTVTTRSSESVDKKGITIYSLTGLAPASEYTVYVRNVSQVRTLSSGRQVAASHAGSVKTFKTVASQAVALNATVVAAKKGQSVSYNEYYDRYDVRLVDKSAKLSLEAKFREMYAQGKYSEDEYIWSPLPLPGNMKKNYTAPKMVYSVSNSNIATVDKGGKITFKGKGTVTVYAMDSNTGKWTSVQLNIAASPDSMTGKSIKLRPGQTINLANYLEYKEKKTKIANYATYADLTVTTKSNEYFEITNNNGSCSITALKAGGKLEIEVMDSAVQKSAKIKLSSTAVEPVKNLKASEVYDNKFKVTFTYPAARYDFRIALRDARGNVISDELRQGMYRTRYDSKGYVYEVEFSDSITLLSNYTVTVTALCEGAPSKEAKLKVKTTNIPASYRDVDNGDSSATIYVSTGKSGSYNLSGRTLVSGNTYTLDMPLNDRTYDNEAARTRLTDTLIWKSSNPKVATIKANAGSFSAKFKTVKEGWTTIEVSSKITKKVIARYSLYVNAVGDARNRNNYYGDNEPYRLESGPVIDLYNETDNWFDGTVILDKANE